MPTQFAAVDPAVKLAVLRGVFEQNKAMADSRPRPESGRRQCPRTSSVAKGKIHWYVLTSAILVCLLFVLAPANTQFLSPSAFRGAAVPRLIHAHDMWIPLTTTPGATGATVPGRPEAIPIRNMGPAAFGSPPPILPWSESLGVGRDRIGMESIVLSSAFLLDHGVESDDPSLAIDEYLRSPLVEPGGYVALLDGSGMAITTLFGLQVRTILIDPGHGGVDPGAIGEAGNQEKDVTLDIAVRLQRRLARNPEYRVLLTRDRDRTMSLKERVAYAAHQKADLFISIHVNSLPERLVNLVETYYFGPFTDERAVALAEQENKGSDYAMADFHSLIQKIGDTLKTQESRKLAADVQAALVGSLRKQDGGITDAGIKTAPFVVLLGVDVPSVLVEVSCISNTEEENRLATEEHRGIIAASIEHGIIRYLNEKSNNGPITEGALSDGAKENQNG